MTARVHTRLVEVVTR